MAARFGPYQVVRELGRGGMGRVYSARDERLGRDVALKILKGSIEERELEGFRREARVLGRLHHPGIVELYDIGEEQGEPYFVMELVEGAPLRTALPPRKAAEVIRDAALAVQYAHDQGILHRDIKPANVLLGDDGSVKLTDFGLAKVVEGGERGLSVTGVALGTPAFMSPEQARGAWSEVDARADVWGLGATLYFALTGRPPFGGETIDSTLTLVLEREPAPLRLPDRALEVVCLKCLEKDPRRRYPTARALADDLGRYLAGEPIQAKRSFGAWRRLRRGRIWIAAAAVAAIAAVGAGWGWSVRSKSAAFERGRAEAERAFAAGDWAKAEFESEQALRVRPDGALAEIWRSSREKRAEVEKRRRVLERVAPIEAIIRDTRPFFYMRDIDIAKKLERVEAALGELDSILSDNSDPEWWATAGMGWYFLGDQAKAEESLVRAGTPRAHYYQMRLCLERIMETRMLRYDEPILDIERRCRELGEQAAEHARKAGGVEGVEPNLISAYAAAAEARDEEALRLCDEALARLGDAMGAEEYWNVRGYCWTGEKRTAAYSKALEICPQYAWAHCMRGFGLAEAQQYEPAIAAYSEAIRINPRMALAYYLRGHLLGKKDPQKGIDDYDQALRWKPGIVAPLVYRGLANLNRGRYEEAIRDLTKALAINPKSPKSYGLLGDAYLRKGDRLMAERTYETFIEHYPRDPGAIIQRGMLRYDRGDWAGTIEDMDRVLYFDPKNVGAFHYRARSRRKLGNREGALRDYEFMLAFQPDSLAGYTERAELRTEMGDRKGALSDLGEALRLNPKSPDLLCQRGRLHEDLGRWRDAASDYARALELAPPNWPRRAETRRRYDEARARE